MAKRDKIPLPVNLERLLSDRAGPTNIEEAQNLIEQRRAQITSKYLNLGQTTDSSELEDYLIDGDTSYDPYALYTRATNRFDHSITKHTPFAGQVVAMVNTVLNAKVVAEYRTVHDYVRNAVLHQLHRDAKAFGVDIESQLTVERMMCWADQQMAEIETTDKLAEFYTRRIDRMIEKGQWPALERFLPKAESVAENLGGAWQTMIEAAVTRAGHALQFKQSRAAAYENADRELGRGTLDNDDD